MIVPTLLALACPVLALQSSTVILGTQNRLLKVKEVTTLTMCNSNQASKPASQEGRKEAWKGSFPCFVRTASNDVVPATGLPVPATRLRLPAAREQCLRPDPHPCESSAMAQVRLHGKRENSLTHKLYKPRRTMKDVHVSDCSSFFNNVRHTFHQCSSCFPRFFCSLFVRPIILFVNVPHSVFVASAPTSFGTHFLPSEHEHD